MNNDKVTYYLAMVAVYLLIPASYPVWRFLGAKIKSFSGIIIALAAWTGSFAFNRYLSKVLFDYSNIEFVNVYHLFCLSVVTFVAVKNYNQIRKGVIEPEADR